MQCADANREHSICCSALKFKFCLLVGCWYNFHFNHFNLCINGLKLIIQETINKYVYCVTGY